MAAQKPKQRGIRKSRDYGAEYREYHGTKKQKARRADRGRARYKMEKTGKVHKGDGKDVDHKSRNTQNNSDSNLRVTSQKKNRGWRKGKK
jgi:hypothetical protein